MKPFRAIGEALMKKFDAATKVRAVDGSGRIRLKATKREIKKPGKRDLVYLDDSPDFCQANERYVVVLSCFPQLFEPSTIEPEFWVHEDANAMLPHTEWTVVGSSVVVAGTRQSWRKSRKR